MEKGDQEIVVGEISHIEQVDVPVQTENIPVLKKKRAPYVRVNRLNATRVVLKRKIQPKPIENPKTAAARIAEHKGYVQELSRMAQNRLHEMFNTSDVLQAIRLNGDLFKAFNVFLTKLHSERK